MHLRELRSADGRMSAPDRQPQNPPASPVQSEHMFASQTSVSVSEKAATLALLADRPLPWNRLAGAIEEAGSALQLLAKVQTSTEERLFDVGDPTNSLDRFEQQVQRWAREGITLVTVLDAAYPLNLRTVHDRPPALFIRGALQDGDERSVAVVGARKASDKGLQLASRVVRDLLDARHVIVSGLAAGIDTAAHMAALDAGARTVAVIGTGLHHSFPKENAELQERLSRESAVISQFQPDQGVRKWTFPQRNAVMSGFARATVVVEASHTSGARMQARLALEHGRPVFLMKSLLTHRWAQSFAERPGAYVVTSGEEIVAHLARLYSANLALAG